ncbi:MAG: hypothetical protein R2726_08235 [Acidimicrobiales bacterium]
MTADAWTRDPWYAVAALGLATAAAIVAAVLAWNADARLALTAVAGTLGVGLAPTAVAAADGSGAHIGLAIATGAATLVIGAQLALRDRREGVALALVGATGLVTGLAVTAAAWTRDPWYTVATLALAVVAAVVAAWRLGEQARDAVAALGLVAALALVDVTAAAAGVSFAAAAVALTVAAGCALVGATLLPRRADLSLLEPVAGAGLALGIAFAFAEPTRGAAALTAAVPALALAGLAPDRTWERWAAAGTAVAATWSWLAVTDVTLVEAYTLPAAALALAAGWAARHRVDPTGHEFSWLVYGPGLALALLPSLWLAVTTPTGSAARAVTLAVVGIGVVLLGVWQRLQAPLAFGALTLVVLAVDNLWPYAAQVPRWLLLALGGALFLWLGATFEHRLRDLKHAGRGFSHLH